MQMPDSVLGRPILFAPMSLKWDGRNRIYVLGDMKELGDSKRGNPSWQ